MKRYLKWLPVLCLLAALTAGATFAKYITNLSSSFTLELLAKWYTLTYDANGGKFENGEEFKTVEQHSPDFTVLAAPTRQFFIFNGWKNNGKTYQKDAIFHALTRTETLTAAWTYDIEESNDIANKAIKDVVVEGNNITFTQDGVDECEIMAFPMNGLIPNATYTLSFAFYWETVSGTGGFYNNRGHWFGYGVAAEIPKPVGQSDAIHTNENESWHSTAKAWDFQFAQGETKKQHYTTTFVATNERMYLYICGCDVHDNHIVQMHLNGLTLERVMPAAETNIASKWETSGAGITTKYGVYSNIQTTGDSLSFDLTGEGGIERAVLPIHNLVKDMNYTVSFKFEAKDADGNPPELIGKDSTGSTYQYGYCLADDTTKIGENPGYTWTLFAQEGVHEYTSSFTATGDTAYLILNFANIKDEIIYHYDLTELTIVEDSGTGGQLQ